MTAGRTRIAAAVGVLVVLVAAGVIWLIRTATAPASTVADTAPSIAATARPSSAEPPETPTSRPATSGPATAGGSDGGGSGDNGDNGDTGGGGDTGGSDRGGRTTGGGDSGSRTKSTGKPPPPVREINVNGPVGGGIIDDPCARLVNEFGVTATVRKVALRERGEGVVLRPGRCATAAAEHGDPKEVRAVCDEGVVLGPGEGCYSGIGLDGIEEAGAGREHTAFIAVTLEMSCTRTDVAPCSRRAVTALSPSAQNPITVRWTGSCECDPVKVFSEAPEPESSS